MTRENPDLNILTPEDLISGLNDPAKAEVAEANEELFKKILNERDSGKLVVLMTAGPADDWLRRSLSL